VVAETGSCQVEDADGQRLEKKIIKMTRLFIVAENVVLRS